MSNLPPTVSQAPNRAPIAGQNGLVTQWWATWFEQIYLRIGGATGRPIIGSTKWYEKTIGQADLASGGEVIVLDAKTGERWKVRGILLSGDGTDFSGGSGDRDLSITDGTSTWTVVPAATLQSLATATWGDTGVPFPATASHLKAASVAGTDIVAKYSGGSNDYTAGECTISLMLERTA